MKYTQQAGGSQPGKEISHPGTCDICNTTNCTDLFDARILFSKDRIWAWVCPDCFQERAGKLGIGKGQHYTRSAAK